MPPGNWQVSYSGWRLRLHIIYKHYIAPYVCAIRGHRLAQYSELDAFLHMRHCDRCYAALNEEGEYAPRT